MDKCRFGKHLDLTGLSNLDEINFTQSGLESINLGNAWNIRELWLGGNNISGEMNLCNFKKLECLSIWKNHFSSINVSKCKNFKKIDCTDNNLLKLDMRDCFQFTYCMVYGNPKLDVYLPARDELKNLVEFYQDTQININYIAHK